VSYAPVYLITSIVTNIGPTWQFLVWVDFDSVTGTLKYFPAGHDNNNLLLTAVPALCNFTFVSLCLHLSVQFLSFHTAVLAGLRKL
jgi:hypothetical protein